MRIQLASRKFQKICLSSRRAASVVLPKKKLWSEEQLVRAMRDTVPRPAYPIPWAEGVQHDQRLDFTETRWITPEDRATYLQKKDLGAKAAEYIIRNMKQEFDYDSSKGEWGGHHSYFDRPQYFKSPIEKAIEMNFDGFSQWLFHIPHKHGLSEAQRYKIPNRSGAELGEAFQLIWDDKSISDRDEKMIAVVSSLIRTQETPLLVKANLVNWITNDLKKDQRWSEYTEALSDGLDALAAIRDGASVSVEDDSSWVTDIEERIGSTFPKPFKFEMDEKAIVKLVQSAKLPNIRLFNSFMRTKSGNSAVGNTKFARNIKLNLDHLGFNMSAATFAEYYRLIDDTHREHLTRQMSEWDFSQVGHFTESTDYSDYEAFRKIVNILKATASKVSTSKDSEVAAKDRLTFRNATKSIEKLILTNPQYLPRDEFYSVFLDLKYIELKFAETPSEVWDAFTSSPIQPTELQAAVLNWSIQNKDFSLAARLYQWLDYHGLSVYSRQLARSLLDYALETAHARVSDISSYEKGDANALVSQLIVVAVKELEYIIEFIKLDGLDELRRSQVQRTVTAAFSILMKCNHERAMREFILSLALDRARPPIENMLVDKTVEFAWRNGYTALIEACLRLEAVHFAVEIDESVKDKCLDTAQTQKIPMLMD